MSKIVQFYADRPIVTNYQNPPVPTRNFDWVAYFDDVGPEDSPCGYGATEREAIAELIEMVEK